MWCPNQCRKPHPPLWVACSNRETIKMAARYGIGALTFAFVDPREARQWVDDYYRIFKEELRADRPTRSIPNVADGDGASRYTRMRRKSRRRGEDGFEVFFRYGLAHHYIFGEHKPGRTDIWAQFRKKARACVAGGRRRPRHRPRRISCEPTLRPLRGVRRRPDRVHPGRAAATQHKDICEALELFAKDV